MEWDVSRACSTVSIFYFYFKPTLIGTKTLKTSSKTNEEEANSSNNSVKLTVKKKQALTHSTSKHCHTDFRRWLWTLRYRTFLGTENDPWARFCLAKNKGTSTNNTRHNYWDWIRAIQPCHLHQPGQAAYIWCGRSTILNFSKPQDTWVLEKWAILESGLFRELFAEE